ncbi:hypothetical protein SBRY_60470 [Actinacidiphila bryophytorum]|uniref:Uncharacterized protein n=1 Tax=Actinacidiphila bryophytorum TaxID=1436133 RepID=A0A9W4H6M1_9ACTN|nr:hypothetical protein SBRY_60470 [Actinacidiphila bryophytorum]
MESPSRPRPRPDALSVGAASVIDIQQVIATGVSAEEGLWGAGSWSVTARRSSGRALRRAAPSRFATGGSGPRGGRR